MVSWQTKLAQIIVSERAAEEEDGVRKYLLKHVLDEKFISEKVQKVALLLLWHKRMVSAYQKKCFS